MNSSTDETAPIRIRTRKPPAPSTSAPAEQIARYGQPPVDPQAPRWPRHANDYDVYYYDGENTSGTRHMAGRVCPGTGTKGDGKTFHAYAALPVSLQKETVKWRDLGKFKDHLDAMHALTKVHAAHVAKLKKPFKRKRSPRKPKK